MFLWINFLVFRAGAVQIWMFFGINSLLFCAAGCADLGVFWDYFPFFPVQICVVFGINSLIFCAGAVQIWVFWGGLILCFSVLQVVQICVFLELIPCFSCTDLCVFWG